MMVMGNGRRPVRQTFGIATTQTVIAETRQTNMQLLHKVRDTDAISCMTVCTYHETAILLHIQLKQIHSILISRHADITINKLKEVMSVFVNNGRWCGMVLLLGSEIFLSSWLLGNNSHKHSRRLPLLSAR